MSENFWFTNKVNRHLYQERFRRNKDLVCNCCCILCVCVCFQWQPEAVSCTSWLQKWAWWMSCIRLLCDSSWDFLTFPWLGENNLTFVLLWAWTGFFSKHGIYPEIQCLFIGYSKWPVQLMSSLWFVKSQGFVLVIGIYRWTYRSTYAFSRWLNLIRMQTSVMLFQPLSVCGPQPTSLSPHYLGLHVHTLTTAGIMLYVVINVLILIGADLRS